MEITFPILRQVKRRSKIVLFGWMSDKAFTDKDFGIIFSLCFWWRWEKREYAFLETIFILV